MSTERVTLSALWQKKRAGEKIVILTAYDAAFARIYDEAGIDCLLVGDSAANVVLGYRDTVPVDMNEMLVLARAVSRGSRRAYLIGDMPFMSYQADQAEALRNAARFMKEAGMDAVKIEGGAYYAPLIAAMTQAGVPVVGHLGLTPQRAALLGGYRVQGRKAEEAAAIYDDAVALESAGAIMLVLECVPAPVAARISAAIRIPVIGIGAGPDVDGQVLVGHDMLGFGRERAPRFVRRFASLPDVISEAAGAYAQAVRSGVYPAEAESYKMTDEENAKFAALHGQE